MEMWMMDRWGIRRRRRRLAFNRNLRWLDDMYRRSIALLPTRAAAADFR